jgi:hypothetical protein
MEQIQDVKTALPFNYNAGERCTDDIGNTSRPSIRVMALATGS